MSPLAATADEQLMRAYATGQAAAFETLYDRHSARVWRYILRSTGDAAAADDLAQEVWFSVAREAGRYAPRASAPDLPLARFTTWLFTLARHRVIDHLRARRPQASLDAPVGEGDTPWPTRWPRPPASARCGASKRASRPRNCWPRWPNCRPSSAKPSCCRPRLK